MLGQHDTVTLPRASGRVFSTLIAILTFALGGLILLRFVPGFRALCVVIAMLLITPVLFRGLFVAIPQGRVKLTTLVKQLKWWHTCWLLAFCGALVFRVRASEAVAEAPLDGWAIFRVALTATTALILMTRVQLWLTSAFRGLVGALAMFGLLSLASTTWSIYPALTLFKSFEYLVDIALVAAILVSVRSTSSIKSLFDWTWTLYALLIASVWVGAVVWPQQAMLRGVGLIGVQLYGVMPQIHANSVGEYGGILGIVAASRFLSSSRRTRDTVLLAGVFGMSVVTLVMSQTRSAIAGFGLGMFVVLLASNRRRMGTAVVVSLAVLVLTTDAAKLLAAYWQRGQSAELLQTLSGRREWWEFSWRKFLERPFTGYGGYAAGRFAVLAELRQSDATSVHNSYLEILLGTGFVGLLPIITVLWGTWLVLIRRVRSSFLASVDRLLVVEALGVLTMVTVRSFFTSGLVWNTSIIFLLIVAYAELCRRRPARPTPSESLRWHAQQ